MTTSFSTKSNQNIEDPLYRLLFSDDEEKKVEEPKPIEKSQSIIKKVKKEKLKTDDIQQEIQIKEPEIDDTKTEIQIDKTEIELIKEKIEFNPIAIKPKTELNKENKSSILEHLVYNLNKIKIPHTIKTFGYHTKDDFITTEYTVIDELSKNTILIVHLTKKQVRYQVPSHQKENKKLSKFAKEFQKQLKYTWLEWF
jgi:hypothetical protein